MLGVYIISFHINDQPRSWSSTEEIWLPVIPPSLSQKAIDYRFWMAHVLRLLCSGLAHSRAILFCDGIGGRDQLTLRFKWEGVRGGLSQPQIHIFPVSPIQRNIFEMQSLWVTTCVSQCPNATSTSVNCVPNVAVPSCTPKNSAINSKAFHIYPTYLCRKWWI